LGVGSFGHADATPEPDFQNLVAIFVGWLLLHITRVAMTLWIYKLHCCMAAGRFSCVLPSPQFKVKETQGCP